MARLSNLYDSCEYKKEKVRISIRICNRFQPFYEHNTDLKSVTGSHEPPQHSQMNLDVNWKSASALLAEQHGCEGQLEQVALPAIKRKHKKNCWKLFEYNCTINLYIVLEM